MRAILVCLILCIPTFAYQTIEEVATRAGGYDIPITVCVPDKVVNKMPVMFFVHGGGWNGGDEKVVPEVDIPSDCGFLCDPLGIIYVGLAYRCKGNKATFHDALEDLEASVAWFMKRSNTDKADLSRNYENRGAWLAISVEGEERERHFDLRKNNHTIYELIVENNRFKSRRNDYHKQ